MNRLEQALKDLEIDSCGCRIKARQLNELLTGYSLFWGTDFEGNKYIEWSIDSHRSPRTITLNF